jgi:hypothetical protein
MVRMEMLLQIQARGPVCHMASNPAEDPQTAQTPNRSLSDLYRHSPSTMGSSDIDRATLFGYSMVA